MAKTKAQVEFEAVTSGFDEGIKSMDQSLGTLRKELKLNSTELKGNADDVDKLAERKNLLQKESDASAEKIDLLTKKLNKAEEIFGENSKEVQLLNNKLIDAKTVYQGIQNEINDVNKKLSSFGSETTETANDLDKLTNEIINQEKRLGDLRSEYTNVVLAQGKNSTEAKELESKMSSLNSELAENKTKLTNAEKASDKFTSSLKKVDNASDNADGGFTVLKGTLADLGANVISSVVSSIGDLIGSLFELGEATEEYRVMQAKLTGASKTFGYDTEFATKKYEEFYRYLGDDQMATNAITNLMGLGTSTENISSIADGAIGVWASYGDSIPIESLTEAINETIQVGKVTGTFADTINWAKISNEEMAKSLGDGSEAQKAFNQAIKDGETQEDAFSMALSATTSEQERADIVARFLNDTYGESKKTYDEMTGSIQDANTAELDLKETQAQMAEAIAPVQGAFSSLKNDALQAMLPVVESLSNAFMEFKGWLDEHPVACDILKVVLITLTSVITALTVVVVGWTVAQWALNSAILANPITWIIVAIVAGITALIAIIVLVIKYWDQIKETALNCWNKIKEVFSTIADWINTNIIQPVISFFQSLWEGIKAVWDGICNAIKFAFDLIVAIVTTYFQIITLPFRFIWENCKDIVFSVWEGIKSAISTAINFVSNIITTVFNTVKNFFSTVWNGIKNVFTSVWNAIVGFITPIVNKIKNTITTVFNAIKNTISNIINTIKEVISNVFNAIKNTVSNIVNGVKTTVTNVFTSIKTKISNIVTGVKDKIVNTFNTVKSKVTSIFDTIKTKMTTPVEKARDAIKKVVDKIKGFFDFEFKTPKIKVPKFSITPKGWKVGDLVKGKIPKLGITWNAKGGIFTKPTILNSNQGLQGVAEAGSEAILPLERLETWINNGFNHIMSSVNSYIEEKVDRLIEINEQLLNKPNDMYVNGRKVSEAMAPDSDDVDGIRYNFKERGLIV